MRDNYICFPSKLILLICERAYAFIDRYLSICYTVYYPVYFISNIVIVYCLTFLYTGVVSGITHVYVQSKFYKSYKGIITVNLLKM